MLVLITEYLSQFINGLSVFQYITLRAIFAAMTSLVISLIFGPRIIMWLNSMQLEQAIRNDGPETHLKKHGTPTMGGALIILAVCLSSLLWADLSNRYVWIILFTVVGFGLIGWIDDYKKVVEKNPNGISAKHKIFWQSILAIFIAFLSTTLHQRRRKLSYCFLSERFCSAIGMVLYCFCLFRSCRFQ